MFSYQTTETHKKKIKQKCLTKFFTFYSYSIIHQANTN